VEYRRDRELKIRKIKTVIKHERAKAYFMGGVRRLNVMLRANWEKEARQNVTNP